MGLDAKLINIQTGEKIFAGRKYEVDNNILQALHLNYWFRDKGLPAFILMEAMILTRDMFYGNHVSYNHYDQIVRWLKKQNEYHYIKLISENDDNYV